MTTRRHFFVAAMLLVAAPAMAGEPPYLTAAKLDVRIMLPPAVVAGSAQDKAEQEAVIAAQKAASPERIKLAAADADETIYDMFARTLGAGFAKANMPKADVFFERAGESEDEVVDPAKPFYGRVRPYLANPEAIKPLVKASKSGAYPSGHTTRVTMMAVIMTAMLPEKRDAIWARAEEYAQSRVIGGMHYPNDLEGGKKVGTAMAAVMFADPAFRADFEVAKGEVRKALGL
jgi:acid phosphatase (class A)